MTEEILEKVVLYIYIYIYIYMKNSNYPRARSLPVCQCYALRRLQTYKIFNQVTNSDIKKKCIPPVERLICEMDSTEVTYVPKTKVVKMRML